jgi:hypothetical protein
MYKLTLLLVILSLSEFLYQLLDINIYYKLLIDFKTLVLIIFLGILESDKLI